MAVKKDCFAYKNECNEGCIALKQLYCAKGDCSFYKSREQREEELKDLKKRGKYE